jgi:hypothetical protein
LFVLCTTHQAPAFVCLDSVPIKHSTAQPRPAHLLTLFSVCAVTLFSLSLFLQPTQLNPHSVVVFNARLLKKGLNYCYCLTPVAPVFAIIIIPIVGCKAAAAYAVQPSPCGGGGGTGTSPYGSCVLLLLLHPSPVLPGPAEEAAPGCFASQFQCDFNSFRTGVKDFFGPGMTIDTKKPLTVVTQFITKDGSDNGDLSEIRRVYVQDGKVIKNTPANVPGLKNYDSISDQFCSDVKGIFGDKNDFANKGGLKQLGGALGRGVVLVMSLWDDHEAHMLWLDSNYPVDKPATTPGVARGSCPTSSGVPTDVERDSPNASVKFSNIKFGSLNSTYTLN